MVWVKIAIFAWISFVIQITIHTFAPTEKLAFLALRYHYSSDPEEDLKVKSYSRARSLNLPMVRKSKKNDLRSAGLCH